MTTNRKRASAAATQDDDAVIDRAVDGLVIVPSATDQSYLVAESARGTHVVFVDREPRLFAADAVVSDNHGGAAAATAHLLAGGHRRIAYLGDARAITTAGERFRGFESALQRAGIAVDERLVVHGLRSIDAAAAAIHGILERPDRPTALFTSQNLVTCGAIKALHALGLQHEVALVGFDDVQLAEVFDPGITVVTQDVARLGQLATERIFARMDGDDSPARTFTVPTDMIVRGSGEITGTPLRAVR